MQQKSLIWLTLILTALLIPSSVTLAQTRTRRQANVPPSLLQRLPASDAVATVKLGRVLNDAMPKLLASNPAKLAEAQAQIEQFKTSTGLDPRSFEEVAFGISYTFPSEGVTKMDTIALARGTFSAGALVAAGKLAANGKYEEQQFAGKTIYIFTLDQQIRLFGLFNGKLGQIAVSALDTNVLAIGDLESVRGVISQKNGRAPGNTELIKLATKDPNALAGFGGNITPELRNYISQTNDTIARDLASVRQAYGSVGMTEKDLQITVAALTVDAAAARNLGNTIEALKQFAPLFVNRLPAAKAALAKSALNGLTITSQGNELQIKTSVAQTDIAPFMAGI